MSQNYDEKFLQVFGDWHLIRDNDDEEERKPRFQKIKGIPNNECEMRGHDFLDTPIYSLPSLPCDGSEIPAQLMAIHRECKRCIEQELETFPVRGGTKD